jgi:hypothetical protein
MEAGAHWPQWIGEDAVISLVLQGKREPAAELASRAIHAIEQLRSTRGELRTLVLAAGDHLGDDIFTARCLICRAAVACMPQRKPALLVFTGHDSLAAESRHELLSLAGALTLSLSGTRIGIRVKLDEWTPTVRTSAADVPEQSGVFERTETGGVRREVAS